MAFVSCLGAGIGSPRPAHARDRVRVRMAYKPPCARDLAKAMCGHWSNEDQAWENSAIWAHIHQIHVPLPDGIVDGVGILSESFYDYNYENKEPYLTMITGFTEHEDGYVVGRKYKLEQPIEFRSATRNREKLELIGPKSIIKLESEESLKCASHWTYDFATKTWTGGTRPGRACIVVRGGAETYLDGTYELSEKKLRTMDVGRDFQTEEIVWGSAFGPFDFDKVESFAELVVEPVKSVS
eukprot:CAMPEP_0184739292 /NCGR_PEP_ID=MMETSP0315-20130426/2131_1 /TAXON_ID=101924 /ORGANISM="Rhodosorus marinus, Strain UTEX LB 2760" /LENGTH=239 /DNA_ID=CAMNT_0027207933 /DNA_START=247 /DNA_END=966 /DNA_ORIENTATION=-